MIAALVWVIVGLALGTAITALVEVGKPAMAVGLSTATLLILLYPPVNAWLT